MSICDVLSVSHQIPVVFYSAFYDKKTGLLDSMKQDDKNGLEILKYNYEFDLTGNLKKLTDSPEDAVKSIQNYSYDLWGRIKDADGDYNAGDATYNRTYGFDDDNRILYKTYEDGKRYDFNYSGNTHAISSIDISGSPIGENRIDFSYDDFGNMTKKDIIADSGTTSTDYIYDADNRLAHIDLPDDFDLDFKYSNGGQRIIKTYSDRVGIINKNVYSLI